MYEGKLGVSWNKETAQCVIDLHSRGMTNEEIGQKMGFPRKAIRDFLVHRGIKSNRENKTLEIMGDMGVCRLCKIPKPLSSFSEQKMRNGKMWKNSVCGSCAKKRYNESCFYSPERIFSCRIGALKKRAQRRGWDFNLTIQHLVDVYDHQKGLCFYSDEVLPLEFGHRRDRGGLGMSVDRVCSELGYMIGNIVLCTEKVNRVKTDLSLAEMKNWLPGWYERLQNRKDWLLA